MPPRAQTLIEELVNSLTHGVGLVASLGGTAFLVVTAARYGGPRAVTAVSVYGASLIALYLASTLYHAVRGPRAKHRMEILDHAAIFLLIAGTYTPIALVALGGGWGWTMFGVVWGLAALGIVFKAFFTGRFHRLSTFLYLGLGWTAVAAVKPLVDRVPAWALVWLLAGGVAYTAGTVFYHNRRLRYAHAVWHVFVLAGSVCHYLAIALYVLPRS